MGSIPKKADIYDFRINKYEYALLQNEVMHALVVLCLSVSNLKMDAKLVDRISINT